MEWEMMEVLDHSLLDELVEISPRGGMELVRELIGLFFGDAPARLDGMRCGISAGDPRQLMQAAHAMKGGAGTIGAARVMGLCARLEQLGKEGTLRGATPLVDALELELPRLEQALEARVERLEGLSRERA